MLMNKYRNENWLKHKYVQEQLSAPEIADLCGCSVTTIRRWMKKHNIPARTVQEARLAKYGGTSEHQDRDWLYQKYVVERKSTPDIASICGVSHKTVGEYLRRFGIEARDPSAAQRCRGIDAPYANKQLVRKLYVEQEKSSSELADLWGCDPVTVLRWVKKHGFETRPSVADISGEDHHNWKGGVTPLNHAIRTSAKYLDWRKSVLERDNYQCVECGSNRKLHADHIVPFWFLRDENDVTSLEVAQDCDALWDLDNGRTLCASCHKETDTWGRQALNFG